MTIKLFSKVIQPTILFLSAAISSSVYDCLMKKYWMESTKSWRNKRKRSLFLLLCNTNNVVLLQIHFYCKKKHPQMRLKDRFSEDFISFVQQSFLHFGELNPHFIIWLSFYPFFDFSINISICNTYLS